MSIDQALEEMPSSKDFAKLACEHCETNDWYCTGYCESIEKGMRNFNKVLSKYAETEGDWFRVFKYLKRMKE